MARGAGTMTRWIAGGALAALLASAALAEPVTVVPPEPLSWYGDPRAPDLSGVWVRADPPPAAPTASKEGWLPWPPPLKAPYAATYAKRLADGAAGKRTDDPVTTCQPGGMPRVVTGMTTPMLLIQTPGRVVIYRDGVPVRRIWLDGRPFPAARNLESFSNGNAMGHYAGQDLVTELRGIRDQPVDATGVPHSDDLVIAERFRRIDANTLRVEVTLTDPTAYSQPMRTTVTYTRSTDLLWEPREFLCTPKTDYHPDRYVH